MNRSYISRGCWENLRQSENNTEDTRNKWASYGEGVPFRLGTRENRGGVTRLGEVIQDKRNSGYVNVSSDFFSRQILVQTKRRRETPRRRSRAGRGAGTSPNQPDCSGTISVVWGRRGKSKSSADYSTSSSDLERSRKSKQGRRAPRRLGPLQL